MRLVICIAVTLLSATAAERDELLVNYRASDSASEYGTVNEVEFSTGLVVLEPGTLAHHQPGAVRHVRFPEPVWLVGYQTEIRDAAGHAPRENYLCHTFFADQPVDQHQEQEFSGIYSDAFTPNVRLPDGFGILLPGDERLQGMPMLKNPGVKPVRAAMKG